MKYNVIYSDYIHGNLKMLHVKNFMHSLRVKWMHRITLDVGLTWSHFIWPQLMKTIPATLLQGLQVVSESCLMGLDPFYSGILRSNCLVNNMFYKSNKSLNLPINLWGHLKLPGINLYMCDAEFFTLADLPKILNKIDYKTVENKCFE